MHPFLAHICEASQLPLYLVQQMVASVAILRGLYDIAQLHSMKMDDNINLNS